jgi:hypothetical protein
MKIYQEQQPEVKALLEQQKAGGAVVGAAEELPPWVGAR